MKKKSLVLIMLLLTMIVSVAFADVIMVMPQVPYETVYSLNGKVDFGWLNLNEKAWVEIRDERGSLLISEEMQPESQIWSCDARLFEEGKLYSFEMVLSVGRISYPFYVSFERNQGIPLGYIDTRGLNGNGRYIGERINDILSELVEKEELSYTTAISEYLFSTQEADTLLHPQMFIIDGAGLGEKGNIETQKTYLDMIMGMSSRAYEDIQQMNQTGQKQIGLPYAQELETEFKAKLNSYTEFFDSGDIEFRYLLNKKIMDYADVLLFTLANQKTGLLVEDAIYMMISIALKNNKTYICLDTDQNSIEQYLQQYYKISKDELLAQTGDTGILIKEEQKIDNKVIGSVRIRDGNAIHVRESESTDGKWVARAYGGMTYECIGIAPNGWYKIRLEDGLEGYISDKLATFAQAEQPEASPEKPAQNVMMSDTATLIVDNDMTLNMPNPQFSERSSKRADVLEIQIEQENLSLKETEIDIDNEDLERNRLRVYRDALIFSTEELNELLWRDGAQFATENNEDMSYVVLNEIINTFKSASKSLTGALKDSVEDAIAEMEGNPKSIYVEMWKQLLLKTAMGYRKYAGETGYELGREEKERVEGKAKRVIDELVKEVKKQENAAYMGKKDTLEMAIEAEEREQAHLQEIYNSLWMDYTDEGMPNAGQQGGLDYIKRNMEEIETNREQHTKELQGIESDHQRDAKGIAAIKKGMEVLSLAANVYSVHAKTEEQVEAYRQAAAQQAYYSIVIESIRQATNIPELQQACDILQKEIREYAESSQTYEMVVWMGNGIETVAEEIVDGILERMTESCVILKGLEKIASTADMLGDWGPAYESGKKLQTLGVLNSSLPLQQVIDAYSSDDVDDYYLTELYRVIQLEGLTQIKDYLIKYDKAVGSDVSEMNIGNLDARIETIDKGIMTNIEIQSVLYKQHEQWFLTDE